MKNKKALIEVSDNQKYKFKKKKINFYIIKLMQIITIQKDVFLTLSCYLQPDLANSSMHNHNSCYTTKLKKTHRWKVETFESTNGKCDVLCNLLLGTESSYCRLLLGTNTQSTVIGWICKVWDLWVFKLSCTHQKNGNLNRQKEDSHWNFHSYI